jgi:hypothetical protein
MKESKLLTAMNNSQMLLTQSEKVLIQVRTPRLKEWKNHAYILSQETQAPMELKLISNGRDTQPNSPEHDEQQMQALQNISNDERIGELLAGPNRTIPSRQSPYIGTRQGQARKRRWRLGLLLARGKQGSKER